MSLKLLLSLLLIIQLSSSVFAQSTSAPLLTEATPEYELFIENPSFDQRVTKDYVAGATFLKLNPSALAQLNQEHPSQCLIKLPQTNGTTLKVLLQRKNILSDNFVVNTPDSRESTDYTSGLYYQGRIMESGKSIVAISIFTDWVMGVLTTNETTFVLGHLYPDSYPAGKDYVLYEEDNLLITNKFTCATGHLDREVSDSYTDNEHAKNNANKSVKIYFEADYQMYQEKGSSTTNTTDYITGFFNVVSALYEAEAIVAEISEIFVWTQDDPYPNNSNALTSFRNRLGGVYNGDLAHLVTRDPGGNGGVAYVDALCDDLYGVAYSNVNSGYNNNPVPTYSWTTMVVTHEMGHNLGSLHTQSCTWAGGAIDNCVSTEDGFCSPGPAPTSGGTIMSYCHLSEYGINFNNGFGPLPGDRIRREVNNAACLTAPTNSNGGGDVEPEPMVNLTSGGTDNFTLTNNILTIKHRMLNTGQEASGNYFVVYFLTLDERFDPADPIIGTKSIPGMAANSLSNQYTNIADLANGQIPNGTYNVGYFIDSDEEIIEFDEYDNGYFWYNQQVVIENALAVTITDFNTTAQPNYNVVNWNTSSESATAYFHVQRSIDGKSEFKTVETVAAAGNSSNNLSYTAKDVFPLKSAYYRLQIENQDGSLEYSPMVQVERATAKALSLQPFFPNPAVEQITVQFTSPAFLTTTLSLMDMTGRVLEQQQLITNEDLNMYQLPVATLSAGIYFVRIENAAGVVSEKIAVE